MVSGHDHHRLEHDFFHSCMGQRRGHIVKGRITLDRADENSGSGVHLPHDLLKFGINPRAEKFIAMAHVDQRRFILRRQFHIRRQSAGHRCHIIMIIMLDPRLAQGRPADDQLDKGHEFFLDGRDPVQAPDIGTKIRELFPGIDMGGLHNNGAIPRILKIGNGGQRPLDINDLPGNIFVFRKELFVALAFVPDSADNIGGKGNFDFHAGKCLLNLFLNVKNRRQGGWIAGAETGQHNRRSGFNRFSGINGCRQHPGKNTDNHQYSGYFFHHGSPFSIPFVTAKFMPFITY